MPTSPAPRPAPHLSEDLNAALNQPLDFPALEQAVIPGDRVALALERATPEAPAVIAATWRVLCKRGVNPDDVVIIQPASLGNGELNDPRVELPEDVQRQVRWKIHDPANHGECTYLATSSSGTRLYLARDVVDADVAISIGQIAFDPVIGYRGTNSVFYPGLSRADALTRSHGQGHSELGPDDVRPLRQLIDEVGWLLGNQFTIQIIASTAGRVARVVAGATDSVFEQGKKLLAEHWLIKLSSRPDVVVAAVDADAAGHGWEQFGAALAAARNLVARDGKIIILSQFDAPCGEGLQIIRDCLDPGDIMQSLRRSAPHDLTVATQLANALRWSNVFLLSRLEDDVVEQLFMIPLGEEKGVSRLLETASSCVFLESAQNSYGRIVPA